MLVSVSYSILYNGFPSTNFKPRRGLQQGDPLSPFLFHICAEGFSALLRDAESQKSIHGVKLARNVALISYLFFVDYTLLFTRASDTEAEEISNILVTYVLYSFRTKDQLGKIRSFFQPKYKFKYAEYAPREVAT